MIRTALVCTLGLLMACPPSATCDAKNCPSGCCDGAGVCQLGNAVAHCGSNGGACSPCASGEVCSVSACRVPTVDAGRDAGSTALDSGTPDAGLPDAGDSGIEVEDAGPEQWISDAGCLVAFRPLDSTSAGYRYEAPYEWTFARATRFTTGFSLEYVNVDAVWSAGAASPSGTVDLALEPNYFDCRYCVRFATGCASDSTGCLHSYFARAGTLSLSHADKGTLIVVDGGVRVTPAPPGAHVAVRLENLRLYEWDLGNDQQVMPPQCVELPTIVFDTPFR